MSTHQNTLLHGGTFLKLPADIDLSEGLVIRARGVTIDHKPGSTGDRADYPLSREHLDATEHVENDHLDAFEVSLTPYGGTEQRYEVDLVATDGGTLTHARWTDLNAFEGNVLYAIAKLDDEPGLVYGLAIRDVLEDVYDATINHGRLYPALDALAEQQLIEKTSHDDRTNEYALTDAGTTLLRRRRDQLTSVLDEGER
ncbi:PadR family transcriptional regulator [Halobaculum gomorrense]|uniref:Transcriptional regulator PadR-like family protein n=1 Tax=Halobaculum gomorrense TaxID=43928 RepID=A0A1M5US80_9EURY|nr:helix-turn-helix transcriptional regulator [Halobaculum gomorrense]SHH65902.1 Transcriptional regulator PadR-like family protein [Halobaculum gomorrense]